MLGGSSGPPMFRELKCVTVEFNTPQGRVFSGHADGVELRTTDGVIAINPLEESYLNLTHTTEITLRVGTEFHTFALENAAACLRDGCLTVVAESIERTANPIVAAELENGSA